MKRHRALVPLSNDHHHALVEARRLRRAAGGSGSRSAAADFLRFFAADTVRHFREEEEEEEMLFPFVVGFGEAREPLVRALLEHQRLHALVRELDEEVERDAPTAKTMHELGELLEGHIRHEERLLFPLIERLLEDSGLAGLGIAQTEAGAGSSETEGPIWGAESQDLNATLLTWRAGSGSPEHVNAERDVLVVVLDGSRHGRSGRRGATARARRGDHHPEGWVARDHGRGGRCPLSQRPPPQAAASNPTRAAAERARQTVEILTRERPGLPVRREACRSDRRGSQIRCVEARRRRG
jgi:hypothetical protein